MMSPKERREAAIKRLKEIAEVVKTKGRSFTDDERSEMDGLFAEVKECDDLLAKGARDSELMKQLGGIAEANNRAVEQERRFPNMAGAKNALVSAMLTKENRMVSFPSVKAFTGAVGTVVTDHDAPGVTPAPAGSAAVALRDRVHEVITGSPLVRTYALSALTGTAPVDEGGVKPSLTGEFAGVDLRLQKLANSYPVTLEFEQDAPQLLVEVARQAQLDMIRAENGLILGAMETAASGEKSSVKELSGAASTVFEMVGEAIAEFNSNNGTNPDWLLANPADIAAVRALKDGNGGYYLDPFSADATAPYGLELVQSSAVPAHQMWVGVQSAITFYSHVSGLIVKAGTVGDQFVRNVTTFLMEERVGAFVNQPLNLTRITLTA
ncbi:phage major capsid protein [Acidipropionibacterium jensenii]|uniref:Phage major capsid protein n=1 Tax=Acidipropionibacterium jensenii TaxID=1749 RepID=A0A3Q9ULS7_9ACTN|nr:phage major capsid protein [Acidipropionibacterium jensenii]AZZ39933.1 phage major capsid protein [Acidipropionibacterium jensenii]